MMKMPKETGFTLVEVMVVVVLIALMGLFVAPDVMNFRPNIQLNSVSREMYGFFQNAKLAAVKNNKNCVVTFNQVVGAETFSYFVFLDDNKNFFYDAGEEVLLDATLTDHKYVDFDASKGGGDGITFTDNGFGNPAIGFQPNGIPTRAAGGVASGTVSFITATSSPKESSVVIGQAGNISIR